MFPSYYCLQQGFTVRLPRVIDRCLWTMVLAACVQTANGQAVPDTSFAYIPANSGFVFTTDVTNTAAAGEASPINSAYVLCKTLVTNIQYKAFCTATRRTTPGYWSGGNYPANKGDHPVLSISLPDAQAYCAWLGAQYPGYTFRVPAEAELENAARGVNKYTYPWGNATGTTYSGGVLSSRMNYNGVVSAYFLANNGNTPATYNNKNSTLYNTSASINTIISISSTGNVTNWINHTNYTGFVYTNVFDSLVAAGGYTSPVYSYPGGRSSYGCYDLAGNAFEWSSSLILAQNGEEAGTLVNAVRGGSWYSTSNSAKTSYRGEGRAASGKYATVGFRVAATATSGGSLPLRLLSFQGTNGNGGNTITWKTSQEKSVSGYTVQRSTNGIDYYDLEILPAVNGTGAETVYTFKDNRLVADLYYYRLKMSDVDGTMSYSSTITISSGLRTTVSLRYQQQAGLLQVNSSNDRNNYQLVIYNDAGQQVMKKDISSTQYDISIRHLKRGIYIASIRENGTLARIERIVW